MFSRHAGLSNPSCVTAAAFSSPNPDRQKHRKIRRPRQRRPFEYDARRPRLNHRPAPQKCREIGGPTLCLARVRTRIASRSNLSALGDILMVNAKAGILFVTRRALFGHIAHGHRCFIIVVPPAGPDEKGEWPCAQSYGRKLVTG